MSNAPREATPDAARARDRLAAVGYIASLISHAARNQFAAIRAALELLEAGLEGKLSAEHRAILLREMDALIGDFNLGVDMIRSNFGELEEVSAREVLEEAIHAFASLPGREPLPIETRYAREADLVRADRRLLRQTVLNLLRNAQEALRGEPRPRIAVSTAKRDAHLLVDVVDNGPGVPERLLGRLFVEAASGREGATGLGLLLCRDAMTVMGGDIRHLPAKGRRGAHFQIVLPLA
jgi:two-component system nitrogen regulation sensor histidine kinase GlnL